MLLGAMALGVYLFTTPGCACGDMFPARVYDLNALNPMRDRAPELVAQNFLRAQGQGKCQSIDAELCRYALTSHSVSDWRLVAREDGWTHVVLYYRVKTRESDSSREYWGQASIVVDRLRKTWQVTSYNAIY